MTQAVLHDKVAFITGAASGIGRAAARLFAAQGACVAAIDRDAEGGDACVQEIRERGDQAVFVQADVTQSADVVRAVEQAVAHFGRLDLAFNVVGVSGRRWGDGPATECTEEAWDRVMDVNLKSVFLCCKYAIPEMLKAGGGAIVNLSSVLGLVGGDEDFATHAYAASKGGIISFTRAVASYYAPRGLRANVICRAQANDELRARLRHLQPLTGDFGQPLDVAHAALYLASDQAAFVTGAVLTVDGGWTVR